MSLLHCLFKRVRKKALKSSFRENQEYGRKLGRFFYYLPVFRERKKIALDNISLAFNGALRGRESEILKGLFEHLGMSLLEVISVEKMKAQDIESVFIPEGLENAKEGGIIVSAHFGNWELTLVYLSAVGLPINVIVRPPSDPFFAEYIEKIRGKFGARLIPKGVALRESIKCLKRGELLAILVDQDEGPEGIFVPFMGRLASTPRGAFTLSLKYDVPLIPLFTWREDSGIHRVELKEPIYPTGDERELALRITSMIERKILDIPSQWLWLHRRWKTPPPRV